MKINPWHHLVLIVFAVVFTVGLTFASLKIPEILNTLIIDKFDFPNIDPSIKPEIAETFIDAYHLRLIGYVCCLLLVTLMIAGFVTERIGLSSLGALGFYFPTFGYFSMHMFFLAGLGIFRVFWFPIWDQSLRALKLADIAYLPYMMVVYPFHLAGIDIKQPFIYFLIGLGLLVFLFGTLTWLYAKRQNKPIADFWLYKFSRHPQYLGWMVWGYGLMLRATAVRSPRLKEIPGGSLPWLISSLVIVGVCLMEELKMTREHNQAYEVYRSKTPFLFPFPKWAFTTFSAPIRLVLKVDRPQSGKQILAVVTIYTGILILLSLPFVILKWPPGAGWIVWP